MFSPKSMSNLGRLTVTFLMGAGQVGRSHGQKIGSEIPLDQTGVPGW
jgi:hypothetical protein